ncbi:Zn-ribbon domain-containing OB-fold protein [Nocardioides sp. Bht2]|uniref:Zn-ribbon domain-containing OB-fold protein n=1 Tax=Nocardioides sp. Bht2 TaxID=3392297 RepID=UPI0039B4075A
MARPVAADSRLAQEFWEFAKNGELVVQQCDSCDLHRHYPQVRCYGCGSGEWHWQSVSGSGTIYSFSVAHHAFHPAWQGRTPYAVATVELREGVRMVGELPCDSPDSIAIGLEVEVHFFDGGDGVGLVPGFRLTDR